MINIHTRTLTDDLASLVKDIDALCDSPTSGGADSKHAFLVLLTDDPDAAEKQLEEFAAKHEIKNIPLTVFDRQSGPPNYKIAKDAEVTVMMWRGLTVTTNHAFGKDEFNKKAATAVLDDAKKHYTSE